MLDDPVPHEPLVDGDGRRAPRAAIVRLSGGTACEAPSSGASARRSTTASTRTARRGRRDRIAGLASVSSGPCRTSSPPRTRAPGCWSRDWRVVGEDDGRLIVQRAGLRLWVAADEIAGGTRRSAMTVSVRLPADLPAYSPGFYIARGDRGFSAEGPRVLDRFYLDLRPEGADPLRPRGDPPAERRGARLRRKGRRRSGGVRSSRLRGARLRAARSRPDVRRRGGGPRGGSRASSTEVRPAMTLPAGAGARVRRGSGRRRGLRLASLRCSSPTPS